MHPVPLAGYHRRTALSVALMAAAALSGCTGPPESGSLFQEVAGGDLPRTGSTYSGTVLDWDGDGLPDLLASVHSDRAALFLNRGGLRFEGSPIGSGLPNRQPDQHGSAACDFDRDGDWDVFVAVGSDSGYGLGDNQLWERAASGWRLYRGPGNEAIADPVGRGRGGLWADFDGDSLPELLLFNYQSEPRLLIQTVGGWNDATARLPWPPPVPMDKPGADPPLPRERARAAWIHTALAADLDGDGRTDLLQAGRPGWSGLLINDPAGFVDLTETSGLGPALWPLVPSHVCGGDIDGDGDLDLVFSGLADPAGGRPERPGMIWINESAPGRPAFRPGAPLPAGGDPPLPLACVLADLDNDGDLDLYLVQKPAASRRPPNRIFRGRGDGSFAEDTGSWGGCGRPGGAAESAIAADFDLDGDLDLLTFDGGDYTGEFSRSRGIALYRNTGGDNRGVTLYLAPSGSAPHGLGAVVRLQTPGRTLVRQQLSVTASVSSSILPVHFGVARAEGPFPVSIRWPGGTVQTVTLPRAGRAYRVTEGRPGVEVLGGPSEGPQ